ncbi:MAG: hypothetical protein QM687_10370 [Ferruginibacter sp.]
MNDPYFFMTVLAPSFVLLPVIVAFYHYRYLPAEGRMLLWYLLAEVLILSASSALAFYKQPNTALYHVATVLETVLLLLFFKIIFNKRKIGLLIQWAIFLFPLLALLNTWLLQPLNSFNSYPITLQFGLMIILCFTYWFQVPENASRSWITEPLNWIISGMLLYFSGSFVLFAFSNYIITHFSKQTSIIIWNVHAGLSVVMYIFMALGFARYKTHE